MVLAHLALDGERLGTSNALSRPPTLTPCPSEAVRRGDLAAVLVAAQADSALSSFHAPRAHAPPPRDRPHGREARLGWRDMPPWAFSTEGGRRSTRAACGRPSPRRSSGRSCRDSDLRPT